MQTFYLSVSILTRKLVALLLLSCPTWAQTDTLIPSLNAVKTLEFSIPTSAAFDLLGVTPAQVTKPGNIRDFKVDWSFQSWRLKPNIAIQAQPIWELLYNRPSLQKYQNASKLMKLLSTLDVSGGTIEDEDLMRRLAIAAKITLFRSHDPLDEPDLVRGATEQFFEQRQEILQNLKLTNDTLQQMPKTATYFEARMKLIEQVQVIEGQLAALEKAQKERLAQLTTTYLKEHWNASFLEVAVGRSYTYQNESLDSLLLQQDGVSVWLNGCVGMGRKWLLTAVARYTEINTPLRRPTREYFGGLNLRYGSPKFNFFVEILNRDRINLFNFQNITIAYGGDWRFSKNVMLSYGIRTHYSHDFTFKQLVPVASIACMMR
ncbi:hypothetical protein P1X15_12995 [Runella sp. MFBS21]|uniref:hypothetical protein n=1 Tax=Runella sp. MFBS21 TaxID=3034018 RepID=UPI0023F97979|nr:hypothetical protein [Runella sp. MFBS21]MDF7818524.1 hypothetical protein [Runella sp. MFBS21]